MNAKQRRLFKRAQSVDLFMDAHAEEFPAGSKGAAMAARLKDELARLSAFDVARTAGASKLEQGSAGRRAAREELRALLQSVIDTSRTVALDRPDVSGIFAFKGADRSDQTLVAIARAAANAAAPLVSLFVEYGLPPIFIDDLRAKADALERYISLQSEGLAGRADSNVSAEETFQIISGLVERLDTAIRNQYRQDHATIVAWERARRVVNAPHHNDDGADTPPPPPSA